MSVAFAVFPSPMKPIRIKLWTASVSIACAATAPVRMVVIQSPSRIAKQSPVRESYRRISDEIDGTLSRYLETIFTPPRLRDEMKQGITLTKVLLGASVGLIDNLGGNCESCLYSRASLT